MNKDKEVTYSGKSKRKKRNVPEELLTVPYKELKLAKTEIKKVMVQKQKGHSPSYKIYLPKIWVEDMFGTDETDETSVNQLIVDIKNKKNEIIIGKCEDIYG